MNQHFLTNSCFRVIEKQLNDVDDDETDKWTKLQEYYCMNNKNAKFFIWKCHYNVGMRL